jgi:hypothetical protein
VAADAGTAISMSNGSATTITVNTGLFAAGDIVTIINLGAGVCTITAGTATVTTSGSLALAQNQGGVLRFTSASAAIFFQFATPASGDIEGVTAGTGISGGGTSGTVTITNSMATEIDAKGDLIVGTGADAFARLAVGTNGHTLVADSSVSPTGLKWAAPSSTPTFVGAYAYNNATVAIPSGAYTAVSLNAEIFDTDAFHSTSTNNSRMTIPSGKGGYYQVNVIIRWAASSGGTNRIVQLKKNNSSNYGSIMTGTAFGTGGLRYEVSDIIDAVPGDYIEAYVYQDTGGNLNVEGECAISIGYLGA